MVTAAPSGNAGSPSKTTTPLCTRPGMTMQSLFDVRQMEASRIAAPASAANWPPAFSDSRGPQLIQNTRVLNLVIPRQQQYLRQDFRRLWIVVGKGQEEPAAVLGVDGDDEQGAAGEAVDAAAAQVDRVLGELAVDQHVLVLLANVGELEQSAQFAQQVAAHLDGGGTGFGIDAAAMGDADHQVHVAHHFAKES